MLIVDYSWSHPDPAKIKAAGYVGAMRYLTSKVDAKLLQAAERDALHAAGLAIGLIWQTTADEARTGALGGVQRALRAEEMATALGYPLEAPLFFAVDFDATPDLARPYFEGILDTLTRPAGVYGSFRVVEGLPEVPYVWQCAAWSRGQISERAHLYQRIGHTSEARRTLGTTDENRLYRPLPLWLPGGAVMWINPIKGKITSNFGPRTIQPSPHLGTDIAAPVGTPIKAPASGVVIAVNTTAGIKDKTPNGVLAGHTGRAVLIDHGAGIRTYAGHMDKVLVRTGDKVKAAQDVGTVGMTGNTYGPHLHLGTQVGGKLVDPVPVLKARGVTLGTDPYTVAYVREVQSLLNLTGAGLVVDGDLGPRTIAAVEAYQRTAGLVVDGDPGPITLAALRNAAIPETPKPEPEDDMPSAQEIAAAVWSHPVTIALPDGTEMTEPAGHWLAWGNRHALAAAQTEPPDVVVEVGDAEAVGEAVAQRLAQMTFTAKAAL